MTFTLDNLTTYTLASPLINFTVSNPPIRSYTLTGTLPPGLSFSTTTGKITGKLAATTPGTSQHTLSATNVFGTSQAVSFTLNYPIIYTPPIIVTPTVGTVLYTSFTAQHPDNQPLFTAASISATAVTYSATGVPVGYTLDPVTGKFYGSMDPSQVPNSAATSSISVTYVVRIKATNSVGSVSRDVRVIFSSSAAPVINNIENNATFYVTKNQVYTQTSPFITIAASNSPTSYAATNLPPGLTIDAATGAIIGTVPSAQIADSYRVYFTAINSVGTSTALLCNIVVPFSIVSPISGSSYPLTKNTATASILQVITSPAKNETNFNITATGLPAGLSLTGDTIGGTPTAGGTYTATISASSQAFGSDSVTLIFNVSTSTYSISGTVTTDTNSPVSGAVVAIGSNTTTTSTSGQYTLINVSSGEYNITVTYPDYLIDARAVRLTNADLTGVNFKATGPFRTLSGNITLSGAALPGITVTDGTRTVNTDTYGNYLIYISRSATSVSPQSSVYKFSPPTVPLTVGNNNLTGQNFTASIASIPLAPTNLILTSYDAAIGVKFDVTSTEAATNAKYQYYTIEGGGVWVDLPSPTSTTSGQTVTISSKIFNDGAAALVNGKDYNLTVRAVSYGGVLGKMSNFATTTPATAPGAPTLAVTAGDASFFLSITDNPLTGGGTVDSHEYSTDNGVHWLAVPYADTITTRADGSNLSFVNGVSYTIVVRTITTTDTNTFNSPASAPVTVKPVAAPIAPIITLITPGDKTLTLTYTPATASAMPVSYHEYSVDGAAWSLLPNTKTISSLYLDTVASDMFLGSSIYSAGSSDGLALSAKFSNPVSAVSYNGALYITDSGNHTIRKLSTDNSVTTFAGTAGAAGSVDGVGAAARFKNPAGIAVDSAGNLYVADSGNNTIRKITQDGVVTTVAGVAGQTGLPTAVYGSASLTLVGAGTTKLFNNPWGLAILAHANGRDTYLLITDSGNNCVRALCLATTLSGTISAANYVGNISLFAGLSSGLGGPSTWPTARIISFTGATASQFYNPRGICTVGNAVYVADTGNKCIRVICYRTSSYGVGVLAGSPTATTDQDGFGAYQSSSSIAVSAFREPYGLALGEYPSTNSASLYVTDKTSGKLRKIAINPAYSSDPTWSSQTQAAYAQVTTVGTVTYNNPQGAVYFNSSLYVLDTGNNALRTPQTNTTSRPLVNGTTYGIRLRGVMGVITGAASATKYGTPDVVPNAPTATATTGSARIDIAYTAPVDSRVTGYKYSIGAGPWVLLPNTNSITTTDGTAVLVNGTAYTVSLRAYNAIGDGAIYTLPGTYTPAQLPAAPIYTATVGDGSIILNISPRPSDVTSYEYAVGENSFYETLAANNTITTIPAGAGGGAITNGSTYTIKLRAVNSSGAGPSKSIIVVVGTQCPAPILSNPTNPTVTTNSLLIVFTAPATTGGYPIVNYQYSVVQTGSPDSWIYCSPANTTAASILVSGLVEGVNYTAKLRAVTTYPATPLGMIATYPVPVIPRGIPLAPTNVTLTPGYQKLVVTFTPPTKFGLNTDTLASYKYSYTTGGVTTTATAPAGTTNTFTITGLVNGSSYTVDVWAVNQLGTEGSKGTSTAASPVDVAPAAPTISSVSSSDSKLTVAFSATAASLGSSIAGYSYRSASSLAALSTAPWSTYVPYTGGSTSFDITGLANGTGYYVGLKVNTIGGVESPAAQTSAAYTPVKPPITMAAPTVSAPSAGVLRISIPAKLTALESGAVSADSYTFIPLKDGVAGTAITFTAANLVTATAPATGYYVDLTTTNYPTLTTGSTYTAKVYATNNLGSSGVPSAASSVGAVPYNVPTYVAGKTITLSTPSNKTLSLSIPSDVFSANGSAITQYEYTVSGLTAVTVTAATTITIDATLYVGTSKTVTVYARNTAGKSVGSVTSNAATPVDAPTGLVLSGVTGNAANITMSYTLGNSNGLTTSYYYTTNSTATTPIWTALTGATTGALTPSDTAYSVQLKAVNTSGSLGGIMYSAALTTVVGTVPSGLSLTSATAGSSQVVLAYALGSNGGLTTTYEYTKDSTATTPTWYAINTTTNPASLTVTGLTPKTAYSFKLRATNAKGAQTTSAISATPYTIPSGLILSSVAPTSLPTLNSLTINYTLGDNGGAATTYQYTIDNGANWNTLTTQIDNLTAGTTYTVQLRGTNSAGATYSNTLTGTPVGLPAAPGAFTIRNDGSGKKVYFTISAANIGNMGGGNFQGHSVNIYTGGTLIRTAASNITPATAEFSVDALTANTAYTFTIANTTDVGTGAYSSGQTFTPTVVPPGAVLPSSYRVPSLSQLVIDFPPQVNAAEPTSIFAEIWTIYTTITGSTSTYYKPNGWVTTQTINSGTLVAGNTITTTALITSNSIGYTIVGPNIPLNTIITNSTGSGTRTLTLSKNITGPATLSATSFVSVYSSDYGSSSGVGDSTTTTGYRATAMTFLLTVSGASCLVRFRGTTGVLSSTSTLRGPETSYFYLIQKTAGASDTFCSGNPGTGTSSSIYTIDLTGASTSLNSKVAPGGPWPTTGVAGIGDGSFAALEAEVRSYQAFRDTPSYSSTTLYQKGDVVQYVNGYTYPFVCVQSHSNKLPTSTNAAYWRPVCFKPYTGNCPTS